MELRFTVWQFVRLMVHLEDAPHPTANETALQAAWRDIWTPLDQQLAELAQSDMDAYSAMMMDQDVVIETATPNQAKVAGDALKVVMKDMDAAIERGGDDTLVQSLKFERRELRQLTRRLERHGEAPAS